MRKAPALLRGLFTGTVGRYLADHLDRRGADSVIARNGHCVESFSECTQIDRHAVLITIDHCIRHLERNAAGHIGLGHNCIERFCSIDIQVQQITGWIRPSVEGKNVVCFIYTNVRDQWQWDKGTTRR